MDINTNNTKELIKSNNINITSFFNVNHQSANGKDINLLIANLIVEDNICLNIVEKIGFKKLIESLKPQIKLPSRFLMRKEIDNEYDLIKEQLITELKELNDINCTSDIWSCKYTNLSILGLTGHFIDNNGIYREVLLGIAELTKNHTALNIASALNKITKT